MGQYNHIGYRFPALYKVARYARRWEALMKKGIEEKTKILHHAHKHGDPSASDAFRVSLRTLRYWRALKRTEGWEGLADGRLGSSGRTRGRTLPKQLIEFIRDYRSDPFHLNAGARVIKPALDAYCKQEGLTTVSISTITRVIADDPDKMRHIPLRLTSQGKEKPLKRKNSSKRRPRDLPADTLGEVVAVDSVEYRFSNKRIFVFTAIDLKTRIAFAMASGCKSSRAAARMLRGLCHVLPKLPVSLLSDNGSEFEGEFANAANELNSRLLYTYPSCPKQNGTNERFNRTLREGFLQTHEDLADDLLLLNQTLAEWLVWYNTERPHRSLNMNMPLQASLNHQNRQIGWGHTFAWWLKKTMIELPRKL